MLTENVHIALQSGCFVENDLEEVAAHRRRADHAHHVALLAGEQGLERVHDRVPPGPLPHIDVLRDFGRHVGGGEQAALIAHLHRNRARADAVENLFREAFRHHAARRGVEHERRRVRGRKPVVQPIQSKIRDRRNVNQNFRHHHEQDGEQQQFSGEADARLSRRPKRTAQLHLVRWLLPNSPQPKIRIHPMMRRTQPPVKLGVK